MRKILETTKLKRYIPSGRAILHVLVLEAFIEYIWHLISKGFDTVLVREIGFLVIFLVVLVIVAWYLPKLSPKWSGKKSVNENTQVGTPSSVSWLQQVLEEDRRNLGSRILINHPEPHWLFGGIDQVDPYFEVIVHLVNTALFPVIGVHPYD